MDSKYKELIDSAIDDLKTKGKRHKQIPNILTLMRLTAPLFIIPAAVIGNVPIIIGLIIFFSTTDFVDGLIARKFNLTSELGGLLDAATDKVFASTLLLATSFSNPILFLNLGLEGFIAGINVCKKKKGENIKSSLVGKVKTWFLFSLVGVGFIYPYFEIDKLFNSLMCLTSVMQIFTVFSYVDLKRNVNNNLKNNNKEIKSMVIPNNCDILEKLQNEKVLEIDSSTSKIYSEEKSNLEQLKIMREFLLSEQAFLENKRDEVINSTNYQKTKE